MQGIPLFRQDRVGSILPGYGWRGFLARWPSRRATILTLIGPSLIFVKLEDHDIHAPILGMSREVARSRHIPVLNGVTEYCIDKNCQVVKTKTSETKDKCPPP
jgi:hypothetical protein